MTIAMVLYIAVGLAFMVRTQWFDDASTRREAREMWPFVVLGWPVIVAFVAYAVGARLLKRIGRNKGDA